VRHTVVGDWPIGAPRFEGWLDGAPFVVQIERQGLDWRLMRAGLRVDLKVLMPRAATLFSLMPRKAAPDLSQYLLSPMPGLLSELAVTVGQEIKAGERLATIEAMKMENILRAERDTVVAEILARPGESLAVDQPILRFAQVPP